MSATYESTDKRAGNAAWQLADYAHGLKPADIPVPVAAAAHHCLTDALACMIFGGRFTWSRILRDHVLALEGRGPCFLPGLGLSLLPTEQAAFIAGAFAHAFELDSLRKPGVGVHPGAAVALPAFVTAQEVGTGGSELLRAIVAACEVMFRIGDATLHSAEKRGFHAPGITGVFGATVAVGLLRGLTAGQLVAAIGIAGSFAGGLLAFAKAGGGGMVKRLHLGRAAQSGVVAVDLAARGYEGPATVLDGAFGVLEAFCPRADASRLVAGLGTSYELQRLCLKRYACHVTAQAPIEFLRQAMAEHDFSASDIASVQLGVSEKVRTHHAGTRPRDVAGAQYSLPLSFATAAYYNPDDPLSFARDNYCDPLILDLADRTTLVAADLCEEKWGAEIAVRLHSGKLVSGKVTTFRGCPETAFSVRDLERKFVTLTKAAGFVEAGEMLGLLRRLPEMSDLKPLERFAKAPFGV